jgi:hypothetical protein
MAFSINGHYKEKTLGSNPKYTCTYCGEIVSGTTRLKVHLSNLKGSKGNEASACSEVPTVVKLQAQKEVRSKCIDVDSKRQLQEQQQRVASGGEAGPSSGQSGAGSNQRAITAFAQRTDQHKAKSEKAKLAVLMFLVENGISFNVSRSLSWNEMWAAVNDAPPGFQPWSYNTLRTTGLQKVGCKPHASCMQAA